MLHKRMRVPRVAIRIRDESTQLIRHSNLRGVITIATVPIRSVTALVQLAQNSVWSTRAYLLWRCLYE
jgi:hypothetical protein